MFLILAHDLITPVTLNSAAASKYCLHKQQLSDKTEKAT